MNRITAAVFGMLVGAMLVYPGQAAEAAGQALSLWAKAVAPSLGPFMLCMLMISSRVKGGMALRIGMGWLCGSPGGARLIAGMGLKKKNALRCAAFTGAMSPMFFIGTVSGWLQHPKSGWLLLFCHLTGALICGLLLPKDREKAQSPPAPLPLTKALSDTAQALLTIGLCMMLGSVAAKMAACALPFLPPWLAVFIQCALEVTGGVKALIGMQPALLLPLICAACSFGGLSILLQNAAFWQAAGIQMGRLFLLRCLHALISFLLCLLGVKFL